MGPLELSPATPACLSQIIPHRHIVSSGPIYICGAEPGDTVKIEILDLYPRPNPKTGKTYGSQVSDDNCRALQGLREKTETISPGFSSVCITAPATTFDGLPGLPPLY